ncbi:PepSY domain-containing protein [Pararhodobacter aggregans]|uniref:PepSY domain-containing protein n=1 Tax=Pararhodobacter aggregans TaxID=404875 RepID=UPI003A905586
MSPTRLTLAAALAAMLALPANAETEAAPSAEVQAQITTLLTAQGYDVRRVALKDGLYEAYAVKEGHVYEIYLNESLEILRTNEG